MFELSVVYFGSVEVDLDVERIIDKYLVVCFVVNFQQSISENCVGLFNILECIFQLSSCEGYLGQQKETFRPLGMEIDQFKLFCFF